MSLKLKFLKGYNGDCILISFNNNKGVIKNILIDGGTGLTYTKQKKHGDLKKEILQIQINQQAIDLLVLTHIDDDHIGGILKMFEDKKFDKSIVKEVWFNSGKLIAEHFNSNDEHRDREIKINIFNDLNTSVRQGVKFDEVLRNLSCWDYEIIKKSDVKSVGECRITILSPDDSGLERLHNKWEREQPKSLETSPGKTDYDISIETLIQDEDIFEEDKSIPNGSSIAFLLELDNKKLLFLGDAHPNVIIKSLKELGYSNKNKIKLDLFKISHHASKKNTSSELLELINCEKYVTLTNSLKHGLPDKKTFARIIKNNPDCHLLFNYNIIGKIFSKEDLKYENFKAEYINRKAIIINS